MQCNARQYAGLHPRWRIVFSHKHFRQHKKRQSKHSVGHRPFLPSVPVYYLQARKRLQLVQVISTFLKALQYTKTATITSSKERASMRVTICWEGPTKAKRCPSLLMDKASGPWSVSWDTTFAEHKTECWSGASNKSWQKHPPINVKAILKFRKLSRKKECRDKGILHRAMLKRAFAWLRQQASKS